LERAIKSSKAAIKPDIDTGGRRPWRYTMCIFSCWCIFG